MDEEPPTRATFVLTSDSETAASHMVHWASCRLECEILALTLRPLHGKNKPQSRCYPLVYATKLIFC